MLVKKTKKKTATKGTIKRRKLSFLKSAKKIFLNLLDFKESFFRDVHSIKKFVNAILGDVFGQKHSERCTPLSEYIWRDERVVAESISQKLRSRNYKNTEHFTLEDPVHSARYYAGQLCNHKYKRQLCNHKNKTWKSSRLNVSRYTGFLGNIWIGIGVFQICSELALRLMALCIGRMNDDDIRTIVTLILDKYQRRMRILRILTNINSIRNFLVKTVVSNKLNVWLISVLHDWYLLQPLLQEISNYTSWDYLHEVKACLLRVDCLCGILAGKKSQEK